MNLKLPILLLDEPLTADPDLRIATDHDRAVRPTPHVMLERIQRALPHVDAMAFSGEKYSGAARVAILTIIPLAMWAVLFRFFGII